MAFFSFPSSINEWYYLCEQSRVNFTERYRLVFANYDADAENGILYNVIKRNNGTFFETLFKKF
jgi:hypothetical protein